MAKATASTTTTTTKKTSTKPKKHADPNKKVIPAKIDEQNILPGTRRRTQVDYSDSKAARAGKPVSRSKPIESANTLEKRASAKIEKKKKTSTTAAAGSKKTSKKETTNNSKASEKKASAAAKKKDESEEEEE